MNQPLSKSLGNANVQRYVIVVGLGIIAGIAALSSNGTLAILGLVPLAFFVAAFGAARSERGTFSDIARAAGIGLLGLAAASVFLGVVYLMAQSLPVLAGLNLSLRGIEAAWVAGGFVLGFSLLLGIVIRVLR